VTLAVALAVSGLFALLAWNAHRSMASLRANLAIEAFFDPAMTSEDAHAVAQSDVAQLAGITKIEFISKAQALTDYTKASGENVEAVLGMNPLPASVKIYLVDPSSANVSRISERIKMLPNIEDVKSDLPLISAMESRSHALDTIALVLCSLLLFTAFFQSFAAARHGMERRRETNRAFVRMGATRWMVSGPMLYYSMLAGIAGGAAGVGLLFFVDRQFFSAMGAFFTGPISTDDLSLSIILLAAGLIIGTIPSLSVRQKV
jgi:cell division protein FtsX